MEIAPTLAWLHRYAAPAGDGRFSLGRFSVQVLITGVGIMAATEAVTRALLSSAFGFALQAGVAGAFSREIALGEVVCVESEALADLGAEADDGSFLDVYSLGLADKNAAPFADGKLAQTGLNHLQGVAFKDLRSVSASTVQTVSGKAETIAARLLHGAGIETMEGAPFHYCCLRGGVPFVQLRAVSNYVEPRDRSAWKMAEAVAALNSIVTTWLAELA